MAIMTKKCFPKPLISAARLSTKLLQRLTSVKTPDKGLNGANSTNFFNPERGIVPSAIRKIGQFSGSNSGEKAQKDKQTISVRHRPRYQNTKAENLWTICPRECRQDVSGNGKASWNKNAISADNELAGLLLSSSRIHGGNSLWNDCHNPPNARRAIPLIMVISA
jgi:hypothetical protein